MSGQDNIERLLAEQGFFVSTTSGYSMWPMLRDRTDRIVLKPVEGRLPKGALPLYRYPDGRYVMHRIIKVKQDCYIIRGDNTYSKEVIPLDWVLGVVTEFYRGEKHILADNRRYRAYVWWWNAIYPLRHCYMLCRRSMSRIKRAVFR